MESGTVPEHKLGSSQASGASPFRFPSVQPLALCCLLQDRLGKVSSRKQRLYASDLNLKVTRIFCWAIGKKHVVPPPPFTKIDVRLSLTPLPEL